MTHPSAMLLPFAVVAIRYASSCQKKSLSRYEMNHSELSLDNKE